MTCIINNIDLSKEERPEFIEFETINATWSSKSFIWKLMYKVVKYVDTDETAILYRYEFMTIDREEDPQIVRFFKNYPDKNNPGLHKVETECMNLIMGFPLDAYNPIVAKNKK